MGFWIEKALAPPLVVVRSSVKPCIWLVPMPRTSGGVK